jgi:hypothetical protein
MLWKGVEHSLHPVRDHVALLAADLLVRVADLELHIRAVAGALVRPALARCIRHRFHVQVVDAIVLLVVVVLHRDLAKDAVAAERPEVHVDPLDDSQRGVRLHGDLGSEVLDHPALLRARGPGRQRQQHGQREDDAPGMEPDEAPGERT